MRSSALGCAGGAARDSRAPGASPSQRACLHQEEGRAIRLEIAQWEELAHPAEFRAALADAGGSVYRLYYNLRDAGVSSFEDAAARTDAELLAIDGIGPVAVAIVCQVLGEHAVQVEVQS